MRAPSSRWPVFMAPLAVTRSRNRLDHVNNGFRNRREARSCARRCRALAQSAVLARALPTGYPTIHRPAYPTHTRSGELTATDRAAFTHHGPSMRTVPGYVPRPTVPILHLHPVPSIRAATEPARCAAWPARQQRTVDVCRRDQCARTAKERNGGTERSQQPAA